MNKIVHFILAVLIIAFASGSVQAQDMKTGNDQTTLAPPHRIIYQLVSGDTLSHKQLMKQIGNIMKVAPGTQIEVVCHGPGLDMLVTGKSVVADKIKEHTKSGVVFYACEFSMKEREVEKSNILTYAGTVPAGIIEIVTRQEQGWSYIKAGF